MWRSVHITSVLLILSTPLNAWEWPNWLLMSPIGYWFMDTHQRHVYTTVIKLKKKQENNTNAVCNEYKRLHELISKKNIAEFQARKENNKIYYGTYGYLYKIASALKEKTFNTIDENIEKMDKSILRLNTPNNSKELIKLPNSNKKFDFLPNPIKEKYHRLTQPIAENDYILSNAKRELEHIQCKLGGKQYPLLDAYISKINTCLNNNQSRLNMLEEKRAKEENEEFLKLKNRFQDKVAMIKKKYSGICSMAQFQKLIRYLNKKTLYYKYAYEEPALLIEKHNKRVDKNNKFYTALLKKHNICRP